MKRPPALACWLLERCAGPYLQALLGDLHEQYLAGRGRAWFYRQTLTALASALRRRATPLARNARLAARGRRDWYASVAMLLALCCFRSAWADWVRVPSGSMNPTIIEGDRLLIDKHVYGWRVPFTRWHLTRGADPQRGQIIVFDSPEGAISLVKRVIGVPGDLIELRDERLLINGRLLAYQSLSLQGLPALLASVRAQSPQGRREQGSGLDHPILLLPERPARRSFGPIRVPAGMYLVLGDNRDNSADSRYFGFVPRANIIGRATAVVVSINPDEHYLPRRERWVESLQ